MPDAMSNIPSQLAAIRERAELHLTWISQLGDRRAYARNPLVNKAKEAFTPFGRYFIDYKYNSVTPDKDWCWGFWPSKADEPELYRDVETLEIAIEHANAHWQMKLKSITGAEFGTDIHRLARALERVVGHIETPGMVFGAKTSALLAEEILAIIAEELGK